MFEPMVLLMATLHECCKELYLGSDAQQKHILVLPLLNHLFGLLGNHLNSLISPPLQVVILALSRLPENTFWDGERAGLQHRRISALRRDEYGYKDLDLDMIPSTQAESQIVPKESRHDWV